MSQIQSFEEAIKAYLDNYAAGDPAFAEKLANPGKSIEECVQFVQSEIFHKYIKSGNGRQVAVCVPSKQECYGLALHYYDEEEVEIRKMDGVAGMAATQGVPLSEEDKEKAREKAIERLADEEARKIKAEEEKKRQKAKERQKKDEESGLLFLFDQGDESKD